MINGKEKVASGLTKRTTINDIKYALLSVSEKDHFNIDDYGIFENWQDNERILDGNLKIYKLIRLWKSLPGNQLANVKFVIKKRKSLSALADITNKQKGQKSPSQNKSWAKSRVLRNKQQQAQEKHTNSESTDDDIDTLRADIDNKRQQIRSRSRSTRPQQQQQTRYSSVKRTNRTRTSTIRKTFIDLVHKQNELIDRQLTTMAQKDNDLNRMRTLKKRSKSMEAKTDVLSVKDSDSLINVNKNDILNVFDNVLDGKEANEYVNLCNKYFRVEKQLDENKTRLGRLAANYKVHKTALDLNERQTSKLNDLASALTSMDKIIYLKTNLIQTLENELKYLDNTDELVQSNGHRVSSSSSASSAQSSTSSLMSSVSQHGIHLPMAHQNTTVIYSTCCHDNESDTGISMANSDDSTNSTQLETLV